MCLPDREPSLHPLPGRSAAGLLPCPGAWVPQGLLPRLVPQPGEQARDSFRLCEPPGHRAAARAAVWAYAVGARGPGGSSPHPARPFPATPSARPPRSPPQGGLGIPGVAAKPQFLPLAARCEDARRRATAHVLTPTSDPGEHALSPGAAAPSNPEPLLNRTPLLRGAGSSPRGRRRPAGRRDSDAPGHCLGPACDRQLTGRRRTEPFRGPQASPGARPPQVPSGQTRGSSHPPAKGLPSLSNPSNYCLSSVRSGLGAGWRESGSPGGRERNRGRPAAGGCRRANESRRGVSSNLRVMLTRREAQHMVSMLGSGYKERLWAGGVS